MIAIIVENCAGCVFMVYEPASAGVEGEYHCNCATDRPEIAHWDIHTPPPDWCPLRESDRLVTLRVK